MNTGTASAQDKEAALGTNQHYGNKFVKRRFFFSLIVQPIIFQGSSVIMLINIEGSCMLTGVL